MSVVHLKDIAKLAVVEMAANGAVFTLRHRENGNLDFLWELPRGGDRSRCRVIIAEAKRQSAPFWQAFVDAIIECAEARS